MMNMRVSDTVGVKEGLAYNLLGNCLSPRSFYEKLDGLIQQLMRSEGMTKDQLLQLCIEKKSPEQSRSIRLYRLLNASLQEYTRGTENYLNSLPRYRMLTDRTLFTSREQYYRYMIGFELVNQHNRLAFSRAEKRIALLPEWFRTLEYNESLSLAASLLKQYNVDIRFVHQKRQKVVLNELRKGQSKLAIVGVNCLVELISLMRKGMKRELPVVGIPLNSSQCPHWVDRHFDVSLDMRALEKLLQLPN